ncbi:hypothetical protein J5N97_021669 [Dioscorea zingiberensis]|uniref:Peroxidase n=1 Tax=Dioscorea zingiberensis TaxID=325984 RepID=A0A9D5HA33_9LILI|nr:hypothetical protein J5N97_021669 [Dioscorea zingiberensis]
MVSKGSNNHVACVATIMLWMIMFTVNTDAQLTSTFYDKSCPTALSTIRSSVRTAIAKERRMAASLIRLHFHDCFVQGCDGSILLDDAPSITSEKNAFQNVGSVRGFEVVDNIKAAVEKECPGIVSCADILAAASLYSSEYVNGPTWTVKLGRRDSTTANKDLVETDLPIAFNDLDALISSFAKQGLSVRDLVALSGAHTIGRAQCSIFRGRIYNDTNIDAGFASTRKRACPVSDGDGNLAPLDLVTPNSFDNNYYKNLIQKKGLLHSDQALFNGGSTDDIVTSYSKDKATFYSDFAAAMVKMGDISPLTGSSGQIRKICSAVN